MYANRYRCRNDMTSTSITTIILPCIYRLGLRLTELPETCMILGKIVLHSHVYSVSAVSAIDRSDTLYCNFGTGDVSVVLVRYSSQDTAIACLQNNVRRDVLAEHLTMKGHSMVLK